jgi:Holliday junction resolvase RusA-like endonuclease
MARVDFWLKGQPVGKGRPRFTKQGRAYTPAKTKEYEHRLAAAASDAMQDQGLEPWTGKCKVGVLAQFEIPKSWPKKRREAATRYEVHPGRPDIDNLVKIALDAINGVVFEDDAQVYMVQAMKRYGDPMILVSVEWDE